MNFEVHFVNMIEIKQVLKGMNRGKPEGADRISIDLIKHEGDFLLDNLVILFIKCLQACSVPST